MNNRIIHTLWRANTDFSKISDFCDPFPIGSHLTPVLNHTSNNCISIWRNHRHNFGSEFAWVSTRSSRTADGVGQWGAVLLVSLCWGGSRRGDIPDHVWARAAQLMPAGEGAGLCAWGISSWQLSPRQLCSHELSHGFAEVSVYVRLCAVTALISTQQMAGGGVMMMKVKWCSLRLWYPPKHAAPDAIMWQVNAQICRKAICWEIRPRTSPTAGLYFGLGWHTRMGISSSPQFRLFTLLSRWW